MLRTTLANLELGARRNLTIGELVVIAAALKVRPATLPFPLDEAEQIETLPGVLMTTWESYIWFTDGEAMLWSFDHGPGWDGARLEWYSAAQSYRLLHTTSNGWDMFTSLLSNIEKGDDASLAMLQSTEAQRSKLIDRSINDYQYLKNQGLDLPELNPDFLAAVISAAERTDEDNA